ncbi:MAG TPA: hypothetical protein VEQ59_10785, partial [Polyangiaceae bacterium]|nr:hypothetical protein [Polyangiaceae bacterium]
MDGRECAQCALLPQQPSAPCVGQPYASTLYVSGGQAPYQWQLTGAPAGWSLVPSPSSSEQATLQIEDPPSAEVTLNVRTTDANGEWKDQTLSLRPRSQCWFAYTALGEAGPALHLVDPISEPTVEASLSHASGARDFQFSPNGKYLAYRFGPDAAEHLALVDLTTLAERALSFGEDSVRAFAWSPDSSLLAAAFDVGGAVYLGAARSPAPGSNIAPALVAATPAHAESKLYWVGSRFVAYDAELLPDLSNPGQFLPNPSQLRTAFVAELGASGFAAEVMLDGSFAPGLTLRPTASGLFMITSRLPRTRFVQLGDDGPSAATHGAISLLSPSGEYSVLLDNEDPVDILSAEGGKGADAVAASNEECARALAWSSGVERLACVADVANDAGSGTHGEVRFFDLVPGDETLHFATLLGACEDGAGACGSPPAGYGYDVAQAAGNARAFSASGRYFAFTRADPDKTWLYWTDLH